MSVRSLHGSSNRNIQSHGLPCKRGTKDLFQPPGQHVPSGWPPSLAHLHQYIRGTQQHSNIHHFTLGETLIPEIVWDYYFELPYTVFPVGNMEFGDLAFGAHKTSNKEEPGEGRTILRLSTIWGNMTMGSRVKVRKLLVLVFDMTFTNHVIMLEGK
ncbi:hypothetical protein C8J55DRAFT_489581 [Lentinula edodes]|uniref:Uncharacterized protein n=1 Tax=Lentinula lateritia TaxID=40482 RepID=A0A9W9ACH1_9AGAR|nr:hypothetical protein C8J55DRAFT_489581 [Lentinula edodes]